MNDDTYFPQIVTEWDMLKTDESYYEGLADQIGVLGEFWRAGGVSNARECDRLYTACRNILDGLDKQLGEPVSPDELTVNVVKQMRFVCIIYKRIMDENPSRHPHNENEEACDCRRKVEEFRTLVEKSYFTATGGANSYTEGDPPQCPQQCPCVFCIRRRQIFIHFNKNIAPEGFYPPALTKQTAPPPNSPASSFEDTPDAKPKMT